MRVTVSCLNQDELECCITWWAILTDVTFLRTLCVSWLICSRFLQLVTIVPLLPSRTFKFSGSSAAHFSFCLFWRPTLLLFVPICTDPFLPHVLPVYLRIRDTATMSFTLVLCLTSAFVTVAPHRLLHSPFHLLLTRLEHKLSFP
jgi:hypothetical protein